MPSASLQDRRGAYGARAATRLEGRCPGGPGHESDVLVVTAWYCRTCRQLALADAWRDGYDAAEMDHGVAT